MAVQEAFKWARDLVSSLCKDAERQSHVIQVDELKTQFQIAVEHISCLEQKITELSTKLESETKENRKLWDQVEYLTIQLHKEKNCRKKQTHLYQKERTLRIQLDKQLEEAQEQLDQQKSRKEYVCREAQREINRQTALCRDGNKAFDKVDVKCEQNERSYDAEIKAENERNATLQQKHQEETNRHAKHVSQEKTFQIAAKLKVEEELSHVLFIETVPLKEALKDQVCQQEEESPAISQHPELSIWTFFRGLEQRLLNLFMPRTPIVTQTTPGIIL